MLCSGGGRRRTQLLHPEGIRSLGVEIGGILVLVLSTAKEAKASGGARVSLLCLCREEVSYQG